MSKVPKFRKFKDGGNQTHAVASFLGHPVWMWRRKIAGWKLEEGGCTSIRHSCMETSGLWLMTDSDKRKSKYSSLMHSGEHVLSMEETVRRVQYVTLSRCGRRCSVAAAE